MSRLLEKLTSDLKTAMKAREKLRVGTIRLVVNALKNKKIDQGRDLTDAEDLEILSREAKIRRESIEAYEKAERADLVEKEQGELEIIEGYLPRQLTPDEALEMVREAVTESGATTMRDLGKVMQLVMPRLKGQFPGKDVRPLVQKLLG